MTKFDNRTTRERRDGYYVFDLQTAKDGNSFHHKFRVSLEDFFI